MNASGGTTIQERFDEYHTANPHVYTELVRLAREGKSYGATRLGIKALCEIVRWDHSRQTRTFDDWKINNNFPACYARLIMQREPDLRGIFQTRERATEAA